MKNHDEISGSLIYVAARLEAIANRYVFLPMGLSSASVKILGILHCDKAMSPGEILEKIGGTKSNISQRLNFLEKEGLIERTYAQYAGDKRKVAIQATPLGEKRLHEILQRLRKANVKLESNFTKQEINELRNFLKKINQVLDLEESQMSTYFKT